MHANGFGGASVSPDPAVIGRTLTYTATVVNQGANEAAGVVLTHTLPSEAAFVAATPSAGTCTEAAGVVTCALGALASGATATVTVRVAPTGEGTLRLAAS